MSLKITAIELVSDEPVSVERDEDGCDDEYGEDCVWLQNEPGFTSYSGSLIVPGWYKWRSTSTLDLGAFGEYSSNLDTLCILHFETTFGEYMDGFLVWTTGVAKEHRALHDLMWAFVGSGFFDRLWVSEIFRDFQTVQNISLDYVGMATQEMYTPCYAKPATEKGFREWFGKLYGFFERAANKECVITFG